MKCLFVSSRSCTILQDAEGDYYAKASRRLFLNNQELPEENRSVFSLFGLWPNTEYTLKAILNDGIEEEIKRLRSNIRRKKCCRYKKSFR